MGRIVFHIGFPKTATTTLQDAVQRLEGVRYLGYGLRDPGRKDLSSDIARAVLFADSRRFEALAPGIRQRLSQAAAEGGVFCSDEAFTFAEHMKIVSHWGRQAVTDHEVVANRLAALAPGAEVLVSIRNQLDLLASYFNQLVKVEFADTDFEGFLAREVAALPHRSMLHLLRYDEMHEAYARAFGAERVHVTLFEAQAADYAGYLDAVAAVCDLPAEALRAAWGGGHSNEALAEDPRARALRRALPGWLKAAMPAGLVARIRGATMRRQAPAVYEPGRRAMLEDHFAASNAAMAERTGLDLGAAGYPVR